MKALGIQVGNPQWRALSGSSFRVWEQRAAAWRMSGGAAGGQAGCYHREDSVSGLAFC